MTDSSASLHRPVTGIMLRLGAAAVLALMFALVKLTSARGVHIVEAVFYRQAFALPFVLGWAAIGPGLASLGTEKLRTHASRMMLGLVSMTLNFLGMILLPLAEATVIGFAVPLFATLLAALFLGEAIGRYRITAVLVGFVGVLVVMQPDSATLHSTGALIALAGAMLTACTAIVIRRLGATEAATTTVFWFTASSLIPLSLLMLFFARAHDPLTWALLVGIGVTGGIAQLLLTGALRLAPVAVVLPMDYTGLIWASLMGWLLFAALPVPATLIGAPIIIASGLAILWREHRLGKAAKSGAIQPDAV